MRRRACCWLLAVAVALLPAGPARAQSELLDLAEELCQWAGGLEDVAWVCYAAQLPATVGDALAALHGEMAVFGDELLSSWLEDALAAIGDRVDGEQLEGLFAQVEAAIAEGPLALRTAIDEAVRELQLSNLLAPRSPEGSPDWWGEEAALQNPNLAAAERRAQAVRGQLAAVRAEAAMVHEANVALSAQLADATATQDAVAAVLRPGVQGVAGGTAARLEERARTAVSSRAALVVLTEGLADLMRQDAVFSGSLVEHLRVLSQQQVQTTWQLQLAVNSLAQGLEAEVAREQAALQRRVNGAYERGRRLGDAFQRVTEGAAGILAPDTELLSWEVIGW